MCSESCIVWQTKTVSLLTALVMLQFCKSQINSYGLKKGKSESGICQCIITIVPLERQLMSIMKCEIKNNHNIPSLAAIFPLFCCH